uniref:Uncharacterized protein n=1 Tax=Timema genevievae TaxID=629358 RepID=A0A7R9PLT5_TIMGE|nr:unnamed protein product [Timema genevievae]
MIIRRRFLLRQVFYPTEIRTSISPSSAVELNTTSALANYATELGGSTDPLPLTPPLPLNPRLGLNLQNTPHTPSEHLVRIIELTSPGTVNTYQMS